MSLFEDCDWKYLFISKEQARLEKLYRLIDEHHRKAINLENEIRDFQKKKWRSIYEAEDFQQKIEKEQKKN